MDKAQMLARLRETVHEPYQLGMRSNGTRMIAIDYESAIPVPAGPLQFLVEPRVLNDEAVEGTMSEVDRESMADAVESPIFDDRGPTVHVMGTEDGLEHLRFDCFLKKPHYHYVHYDVNELVTVRIDQFAEGDPIDWAIGRLRLRLPEMLDQAGASDLADAVRANQQDVMSAIDKVEGLVRSSNDRLLQTRSPALA